MELFILCVVASMLTGQLIDAGGIVMVQLVEYDNPEGEGSNGHCCDGKWGICQDDGCDHKFEICVTSQSDVDAGCSASGWTTTKVFKNSDHNEFTGDDAVQISMAESHVASDYNLKVIVKDDDNLGDDDDVDTLTGSVHLDPVGSTKLFTISDRTELRATIWYTCDDHYYDCDTCGDTGTPRCSVYCDANGTHGSCDEHGNLVCDEGYTGDRCMEEVTTTTTTTTTTTPPGPVPTVVTINGVTMVQVDVGIYSYYAVETRITQPDMYEACSNMTPGTWPAIINDEQLRTVGDAMIRGGAYNEFWVVDKSREANHEQIASMADTKSCGANCVLISSWDHVDEDLYGEHYNPYSKECGVTSGVLCQGWTD